MSCNDTISTLFLNNEPDYVLFKVAIDFAERGLKIWFISIAPFEKVPENIQQPCKEVLQLITFIYLKDFLDLVRHLNGIHKWQNIPNIIIVRDFDRYCSLRDVNYNPRQTAFLSATLLDSVTFLARKKGCTTFLLVCLNFIDQKSVDERLQVLYDMYFDNFLVKSNFKSEEELVDNIKNGFLINKTADN